MPWSLVRSFRPPGPLTRTAACSIPPPPPAPSSGLPVLDPPARRTRRTRTARWAAAARSPAAGLPAVAGKTSRPPNACDARPSVPFLRIVGPANRLGRARDAPAKRPGSRGEIRCPLPAGVHSAGRCCSRSANLPAACGKVSTHAGPFRSGPERPQPDPPRRAPVGNRSTRPGVAVFHPGPRPGAAGPARFDAGSAGSHAAWSRFAPAGARSKVIRAAGRAGEGPTRVAVGGERRNRAGLTRLSCHGTEPRYRSRRRAVVPRRRAARPRRAGSGRRPRRPVSPRITPFAPER